MCKFMQVQRKRFDHVGLINICVNSNAACLLLNSDKESLVPPLFQVISQWLSVSYMLEFGVFNEIELSHSVVKCGIFKIWSNCVKTEEMWSKDEVSVVADVPSASF